MKKLIYMTIVVSFFMVSLAICASASSGYLVLLKEGFCPDEGSGLTLISEGCRLYYAEDEECLTPIENNIETLSPNIDIKAPELIVQPSLASSSYYASRQWAIDALKATVPWELETYGNDIKVAVIDSGYSYHADLDANVLPGENYYVTVDNIYGDFSNVSSTDVTDNHGHGTHVSGIIAAVAGNGIGIKGIAPKAKIVPLKCFDPDYGTSLLMLANAICDAVDEYGCQVINMSWVATENTQLLKEVIDYAYSKGAILVAAAGNDGNSTLYYPAGYSNVIGVGSIDSNKSKSYFSNYNKSVTIVAPGADIISTYKGTYVNFSGTSQATPMISALAAIALSAKPDLTNAEFTDLLTSTAEDLGNEGYDVNYGYGLADAKAMMEKLLEDSPGYISPVNYENDIPYVLIKNTADTEMEYFSGFADYASAYREMIFCNAKAHVLSPGESLRIDHEYATESPTVFFWQNSTLTPLWYKR